jgi:hypothetical protein
MNKGIVASLCAVRGAQRFCKRGQKILNKLYKNIRMKEKWCTGALRITGLCAFQAYGPPGFRVPSSLLRFAHKIPKKRLQGAFYPANCQSRLDNRDFCVTDGAKIHKCNRLLGRLRLPRLTPPTVCRPVTGAEFPGPTNRRKQPER